MSLLLGVAAGVQSRSATFIGVGQLQATAVRVRSASVAFAGVGVLVATGQVLHLRTVTFPGVGTLTAVPTRISVTPTGVGGRRPRRRAEAAVAQLAQDLQWEPPKPWAADDAELEELAILDLL